MNFFYFLEIPQFLSSFIYSRTIISYFILQEYTGYKKALFITKIYIEGFICKTNVLSTKS